MAVIGLLGTLSLRDGFSGDQALFLIFSKAIKNGAVLYRDVWDIKQPGIFVFYLIAGVVFGFTEVGVHLLEMVYWLSFSLILIYGLKDYFKSPLFATVTPLFTIGIYYSVSGSLHYTQVESLVCFPLFMTLWFCHKFLENPQRKGWMFFSGLMGGIVLSFKLILIIIPVSIWLFYFLFIKKNTKEMAILSGLIVSGSLIPIGLVIFYFVRNDALFDLWYTTFVYPFTAVLSATAMIARPEQLKDGLVWFFKSYFPVVSLTLVFVILKLRSIYLDRRQEKMFFESSGDFFSMALLIWCFAGFTVIFMQRLSWWQYHYSLLMVPVGVLAVKCLENVFEEIRTCHAIRRKPPVLMILAIIITPLFIPTARRLADRIRQFNLVESVRIGDKELKVTGSAAEDYKSIAADTSFLRLEHQKTTLFVVSNPLYYYLSDISPSFRSNGAMTDMFTPFEWDSLNGEMSNNPPMYVFMEERIIPMIVGQNPEFLNFLNKYYSISSTGDRGSFYKLNE